MTHEAAGDGDAQRTSPWTGPAAEQSAHRFPDGGAYRVEIPSVEGPEPLEAVLDEAARRGVTVHRVSQGSGVSMLTDDEVDAMVGRCAQADVELCLFLGPRATWDVGASSQSPSGGVGARVRGRDQLRFSVDDAVRATERGVRCLLVADEGVLWTLHGLREDGTLPADTRLKMSALSGPANPASFEVVQLLGADSVNVPSDLTVDQLAALRTAADAPLDVYVESPDGVGGFVRHHEAPALVAATAPLYLKYGLRNAPDIYPVGGHLTDVAVATGRERVRRAALGAEHLARAGVDGLASPAGAREPGKLRRFPVGA